MALNILSTQYEYNEWMPGVGLLLHHYLAFGKLRETFK